jgi:hypothetical protein
MTLNPSDHMSDFVEMGNSMTSDSACGVFGIQPEEMVPSMIRVDCGLSTHLELVFITVGMQPYPDTVE